MAQVSDRDKGWAELSTLEVVMQTIGGAALGFVFAQTLWVVASVSVLAKIALAVLGAALTAALAGLLARRLFLGSAAFIVGSVAFTGLVLVLLTGFRRI